MSDVAPHVMRLFLDELSERTTTIDRDLLRLEDRGTADRGAIISALLREAHSLKGAAGAVGASQLAALCHGIEDLLSAARDDLTRLDDGILDTLFSRVDALRDAAKAFTFAPADGAASAEQSTAGRVAAARVASDKLDGLLRDSGELLVANHHAEERLEEATIVSDLLRHLQRETRNQPLYPRLREIERAFGRLTSSIARGQSLVNRAALRIDGEVRRIRMVPFSSACEGLERLVRDAAHTLGKTVVLRIEHGEIEIDRAIAQSLRDPLAHLVRNAVDHGIETADRRAALGKAALGTITVSAALRGSGVEIVVSDDGAGFDVDTLRQRAIERGFDVDVEDHESLIFLPGVSTATSLTGLSGRGVGLDAVRSTLDALRGTIAFSSQPRRGTRFVLTMPLTLTTLRALLVRVTSQVFAIDVSIVHRLERVERERVSFVEGRPVIMREGVAVPLVALHALLGLSESEQPEALALVVLDAGGRDVAVIVDEILDEREIVVRSLGRRLSSVPSIAGATILQDGSLVLIARSGFIIERALRLAQSWRPAKASKREEAPRALRVLLVDDSVTTRTLECSILEAAGYEVVTAGDGSAALHMLERQEFDVIVSDVEMPSMDGFTLARSVRASQRLRDLPFILVTSKDRDEDRRQGLESGADAYICKSGFDQRELLETMKRLVS